MSSSTPSLDSSLVLKFSGASSTSPSRLPRMFVEYQPARPSWRALSIGASTVLISVWPVLKSLPLMGMLRSVANWRSAGVSTVRFGRAVGERHALQQGGVGVEHRRGDLRVVGVDRLLERLEVHVRRAGLDVDLGARRPDHHDALEPVLVLEAVDVLADLLEHRPLAADVHDVLALEAGGVLALRTPRASGGCRAARRRPARCACHPPARRRGWRRRRRRRGTTSHAPHTMSSSVASGTKSLTSGLRSSVRLPSRIVPICVRLPIGLPMPRLTSSTPAMRVEATAPRPTVSTPRRPVAGAISRFVMRRIISIHWGTVETVKQV